MNDDLDDVYHHRGGEKTRGLTVRSTRSKSQGPPTTSSLRCDRSLHLSSSQRTTMAASPNRRTRSHSSHRRTTSSSDDQDDNDNDSHDDDDDDDNETSSSRRRESKMRRSHSERSSSSWKKIDGDGDDGEGDEFDNDADTRSSRRKRRSGGDSRNSGGGGSGTITILNIPGEKDRNSSSRSMPRRQSSAPLPLDHDKHHYSLQEEEKKKKEQQQKEDNSLEEMGLQDRIAMPALSGTLGLLKLAGGFTLNQTGKMLDPTFKITKDLILPSLMSTFMDAFDTYMPQRGKDWIRILSTSVLQLFTIILGKDPTTHRASIIFRHRFFMVLVDLLDCLSSDASRQCYMDGMSTTIRLLQALHTPETQAFLDQASITACRFVDVLSAARTKRFIHDFKSCSWTFIELLADPVTTTAFAEVTAYLCHALEMEEIHIYDTVVKNIKDDKAQEGQTAAKNAAFRAERRKEQQLYQKVTYKDPLLTTDPTATIEQVLLSSMGMLQHAQGGEGGDSVTAGSGSKRGGSSKTTTRASTATGTAGTATTAANTSAAASSGGGSRADDHAVPDLDKIKKNNKSGQNDGDHDDDENEEWHERAKNDVNVDYLRKQINQHATHSRQEKQSVERRRMSAMAHLENNGRIVDEKTGKPKVSVPYKPLPVFVESFDQDQDDLEEEEEKRNHSYADMEDMDKLAREKAAKTAAGVAQKKKMDTAAAAAAASSGQKGSSTTTAKSATSKTTKGSTTTASSKRRPHVRLRKEDDDDDDDEDRTDGKKKKEKYWISTPPEVAERREGESPADHFYRVLDEVLYQRRHDTMKWAVDSERAKDSPGKVKKLNSDQNPFTSVREKWSELRDTIESELNQEQHVKQKKFNAAVRKYGILFYVMVVLAVCAGATWTTIGVYGMYVMFYPPQQSLKDTVVQVALSTNLATRILGENRTAELLSTFPASASDAPSSSSLGSSGGFFSSGSSSSSSYSTASTSQEIVIKIVREVVVVNQNGQLLGSSHGLEKQAAAAAVARQNDLTKKEVDQLTECVAKSLK